MGCLNIRGAFQISPRPKHGSGVQHDWEVCANGCVGTSGSDVGSKRPASHRLSILHVDVFLCKKCAKEAETILTNLLTPLVEGELKLKVPAKRVNPAKEKEKNKARRQARAKEKYGKPVGERKTWG